MATSGKKAWLKYFSSGDVTTVTKHATTLRVAGGSVFQLTAGTDIIVKGASDYSSQQPVQVVNGPYKGKVGTIKFNDIQKPLVRKSGGGSHRLQPKDFGIEGTWLPADEFVDKVMRAIDMRDDLSGEFKTFLQHLLGFWARDSKYDHISLKHTMENGIGNVNIREVEKDFGEIVCAVAMAKNWDIYPSAKEKRKFDATVKVFFPSAQNQGVYDFILKDTKNGEVRVSTKSGSSTNTLSPNDVVEMIKARGKAVYGKFQRKLYFKVVEALAEENVILGPMLAVSIVGDLPKLVVAAAQKKKWSRKDGDNAEPLPPEIVPHAIKFIEKFGSPDMQTFVKKNPANVAVLTAACEYHLKKLSKQNQKDFDEIFNEAVVGDVLFCWFSGVTNSNPKGAVMTMETINGVYLRSKNNAGTSGGRPRFADKMGLQP